MLKAIAFEGKTIALREAKSGDEEMVNAFFDRMGGESRAVFNRGEYNRKGLLKFCQKGDATRKYWLLVDGNEMLGYVFFLDWNMKIPTLGVAVRDDLRGRRLGRSLCEAAIEKAKQSRKGGIMLTTHPANARAQTLYESLGFRCFGIARNCVELFYILNFKDETK
ncbi:MAG: GNAT family N-acetyltransferase [Clostridia bacterium]|nr:GNAT family N-acetyltransferase [Clostridia bacterium]